MHSKYYKIKYMKSKNYTFDYNEFVSRFVWETNTFFENLQTVWILVAILARIHFAHMDYDSEELRENTKSHFLNTSKIHEAGPSHVTCGSLAFHI